MRDAFCKYLLMKLSVKDIINLIITIFVTLIFSIGLKSCCTEKYCFGAENLGGIEFINFLSNELDSTYLVFYQEGSDFLIVEDSIFLEINEYQETNTFYGQSSRNISIYHDYRLYLINSKSIYTINEFNTSRAECNECFLKKDYYQRLENYKINGKVKQLSFLQIDKSTD